MSIGIVSMLNPFEERVDRWVATGNATRILVHPEDWHKLSDTKREQMEQKYNLPVEVLGGQRGYFEWMKRNVTDIDFDIEAEAAKDAAENVLDLDDE